MVLAPNRSREALIEAFRKRHCYAATDNIILDVRSGEHLMGDVFETDKPPTLKIVVQGTAPVTKLHVIRDRRYALTTEPGESRAGVPLHRRRRQAWRESLLLRPGRASRPEHRLGLADVDHLQETVTA